jgi:branched-chain amino acid transport system permease protein
VLLGVLLLAGLVAARVKRSYVGRALMAIREDETAAEIMGVQIRKFKMTAFIYAAFFAGLAGALYAHFAGYISPESFTGEQSNNLFSMSVVGGLDSIPGGIISGVTLTLLPELMRFLQVYYMLIFSLIVLVIVLLPPDAGEKTIAWVKRLFRVRPADRDLPPTTAARRA